MRKRLLIIIIPSLILIIICSYFILKQKHTFNSSIKVEGKAVIGDMSTCSGTCNITVSKKLELLEVIQYLADDPLIIKKYKDNTYENYIKGIDKYFTDYKGHKVIRLYKEMRGKGFSYGRIPELTLKIDENFNLSEGSPEISKYLDDSGISSEELDTFLEQVRDFYTKANFDEFYLSQKDFYNSLLAKTKNLADKVNFIDKLNEYYGYKQESYNIFIYPLINGGFADRIQTASGRYDIYDFMKMPTTEIDFMLLLIHEFGHAYTGPLTYTKYSENVGKFSSCYEKIRDKMKKQNYMTWGNSLDELINRAVTIRILTEIYGDKVGNNKLNQNIKEGFIYIDMICESLKKYEVMRDKYPIFDDYYLEILKTLPEQ